MWAILVTPTSIKIVAGLLLIVGIIFGVNIWKKSIREDERNKVNSVWQKRIDDANIAAQNELLKKNEEVRSKQELLDKAHREIVSKNRELDNATKNYNKLRDQYLNGTKRLSISPKPNKDSGAKQDQSSSAARGTDEGRIDILPELSVEILDFARDYQRNLRLKNECIDLYKAAEDAVNNQ